MSVQKKEVPSDFSSVVFAGKQSHEATINSQLNFLEFLIVRSNQSVTIGIENIEKLWQIYVHQPNFSFEQSLFLKWINQHRQNPYDKSEEYFLFDDEERKYFFIRILCNPTFIHQSISYS